MLSGIPIKTVLAFCGIGKPDSFRNSLEEAGIRLEGLEVFPDHHVYSKGDIDRLREIMERTGGSALITTAKDAVKLYGIPDTGDILVQTMNLDVEGALPELMNDIQRSIDSHRKRNRKTGIL